MARPVDGADPPLVPGEPELRSRAATAAVLIDPTTWDRLTAHAQRHARRHRVTLPP